MEDNIIGDPVDAYLQQWGLPMYIEIFKAQAINDLETLQMLDDEDIQQLIPMAGHRAKLKTQIRMLKSITQAANSNDIKICEDPECLQQDNTTVTTYFVQSSTGPSELIVEDLIEPTTPESPDTSCELYKILNSTNDGKGLLLNKNKESRLLNNRDRRKLCSLIIDNELRDHPNKKITSARLYELAYSIPKIFDKENSSVYFIPYTTITTKQKICAKGKLLDCYRQRRREFIKTGVILDSNRRPSSSASGEASPGPSTEPNIQEAINQLETLIEDIEDKIIWLQNCCDPWATVETYWDITSKQRLTELTSPEITVDQYIRKYKALNQPGGVFLVLKDFKKLFPNNDDKLHQNWPLVRSKLIDFTKTRQDSGLKDILSIIENNDTEEHLDIAALMSLPFLMTTSMLKTIKEKKKWKPSKLEVLDSFICHVKSAAEVDEAIQRRKDKIKQMGLTFQPYLIIVGPTLKEITSRYIVLNHLRYERPSIVKCVDACFKIIFALNAEYSPECRHVWQFIQKTLYNLNTKYDKIPTTVRTLATDLGLEY